MEDITKIPNCGNESLSKYKLRKKERL